MELYNLLINSENGKFEAMARTQDIERLLSVVARALGLGEYSWNGIKATQASLEDYLLRCEDNYEVIEVGSEIIYLAPVRV